MRSAAASVGVALFAASSLLVLTRGAYLPQLLVSRRLPFLRRRDELGVFFTQDDVLRSDRWRFLWSKIDEEDEEGEEEEEPSGSEGVGGDNTEGKDEDGSDDKEKDSACELELINTSGQTLVFCWIGSDGSLHHYYSVQPEGAIKDGSVAHSHVEYTHVGHSFICLRQGQGQGQGQGPPRAVRP
jgi:hypothetical protein